MGLPVWRAPSPTEARIAAAKNDASASARSPIRRRRSPIPSRRISVRHEGSTAPRRYISLTDWALIQQGPPGPRPESDRDAERRESDRRENGADNLSDDGWLNDQWLAANLERDHVHSSAPESRNQTRSPEERVHLYVSADRPTSLSNNHGSDRAAPHPPNPFSRTPSALSERGPNDTLDRSRARDGLEREPRSTPAGLGGALSRRINRSSGSSGRLEPLGELPRHSYRRAPVNFDSHPDLREAMTSSDAVRDFPPLRRMGRRQVTDGPLPASSLRESWSPIDGLGDRERSISPPQSDHWETMLTTITPDAQLPSADSSFTSAAASASFSNNNNSESSSHTSRSGSATSSRTHLTIPSRRHSPDESSSLLPPRICDTDDDMSGTDTDDDNVPRSALEPLLHRARGVRMSSHSQPEDAPPARNPAAYSSHVRSRSNDAIAFVRNYYSFVERAPSTSRSSPSASSRSTPTSGPGESGTSLPRATTYRLYSGSGRERSRGTANANRSISGGDGAAVSAVAGEAQNNMLDPELETMREILERLARRDDVPEEFWLSAGLAPPMLEGVERMRRERGRL